MRIVRTRGASLDRLLFHVYHGYMQKIQILFPDPMMKRIRKLAAQEDVSISDLVRRATDCWLERFPVKTTAPRKVPVIDAGRCLLDTDAMKEALHE